MNSIQQTKASRIKAAANKCKEHCNNTIIPPSLFDTGNSTESAHKVLKGNAERVRSWAYGKDKSAFVSDIDRLICEIEKNGNYANGGKKQIEQ